MEVAMFDSIWKELGFVVFGSTLGCGIGALTQYLFFGFGVG